jgi:aryl-alcohol dehydrogenase-like predicted oxidoreductase
METIFLGSQGPPFHAKALVVWACSDFYGATDDDESIATIQRALDLGVTLFDTADIYGPHKNEVLVGRALGSRRDEAIVATKFGIVRDPDDPTKRGFNGHPEYVHQACDASLARLGIEHIDLYYQHRVDTDTPIEETVGAMGELVKRARCGTSDSPKRHRRTSAGRTPCTPSRRYRPSTRCGPETPKPKFFRRCVN